MHAKSVKKPIIWIILTVCVVILFAVFLIIRSGRLEKEPVVTVKADNCYTQTLRAVTDRDYKPYSYNNSQNDPSGHDVELITYIANHLHMNLELRLLPWDECITALQNGEADVLMTCDYFDTFPEAHQFIKTQATSYDDFIVYSRQDISSEDMLYNKKIAITANGNVDSQISLLGLQKNCTEYADNRAAINAVINKKADCAIMRGTIGSMLLKEMNETGIQGRFSIGKSYMCLDLMPQNNDLAKKINYVLETLRLDGTMTALRDKWLTTFVQPYSLGEIITDNTLVFIAFLLAIAVIAVLFILTRKNTRKAEDDKNNYVKIVENLANDFECVIFVTVFYNKMRDNCQLLRSSPLFDRLIPGWSGISYFGKRLTVLRDTLVAPEDRAHFSALTKHDRILSQLNDQEAYFVKVRLMLDGQIRYYQLKFSAVRNETGLITGVVCGLHNVDAETRKELALQEQLRKANQSKTDFLFSMSHDIRTPMNAIMGFTDMAVKHMDDPDKVRDCLTKTKQSGALLLSLINGILDMSRIDSGKANLEMIPTDICSLFSSVDDTMQVLARQKNITLTLENPEVTNRYVSCDVNRLLRILVNLISNAVKYTLPGGNVRVSCSQITAGTGSTERYRLTVSDNGIGMSEEFQKHLFEAFAREYNSTTSGIQGTGLGLSVCKAFVDLMQGTIVCQSKQGEGSTFTVTLPLHIISQAEYEAQAADPVLLHDEKAAADHSAFEGKKILLVEDNELNREIATDILEEEGFVIEQAEDGQIAVDIMTEKGPSYFDFILMDIQMPVMNGYEATRAIRKMYPDVPIPIIALSANAFAEDKQASLTAGMNDHIAKPIDTNVLFACLAKYL